MKRSKTRKRSWRKEVDMAVGFKFESRGAGVLAIGGEVAHSVVQLACGFRTVVMGEGRRPITVFPAKSID